MASPMNGSMPVVTRDNWFDRLARRAAGGGMSRRDAVGIFAGTTAMAILGSLVKPGSASGATHTQGDSGCSGKRKPYTEGCPKPVPKNDYKPGENGCGPQKGFDPVPDRPLNVANFNSACNGHDRGYGTCNVPKETTDKLFLGDMVMICVNQYPITGPESATGLYQCTRAAELYYQGVKELGGTPYKDGQSEGCDCCEGECAGGTIKCNGQCCPPAGTYVCGSSGLCCADCQPGWIKCPYPANARCGFGCCMPGAPICCPGMQPGSLRCCNGKCYKGGCG
jgi:hypothetical protein